LSFLPIWTILLLSGKRLDEEDLMEATVVTPRIASNLVKIWLRERGFTACRVSKSRTVGFSGFGYGSCVFVTVEGWEPHPAAGDLERYARDNGFRVEFEA
jgi:hypothetical protein